MEKTIVEKSSIITYPHAFSTRIGGVSEGIYASLNLGMNRGDDKDKVIKNWDLFLDCAGVSNREFVCGSQVHGNNVVIASRKDLRPAYGEGFMHTADGYVTNESKVPLAIFTADCVPLLLEDSVSGVIGAIHCGWRSTVSDIEGVAISKMIKLGSKPSDIKAAIGPAIDMCCFEVGSEVIEAVRNLLSTDAETLYISKPNGKYMLDLRGVVRARLLELGLIDKNIERVGGCTMCHPDRYWSHRYTNGSRGSLACIIERP